MIRKITKIVLVLLVALTLTSSEYPVLATEGENTKIEIDTLNVIVPYNINEIEVIKEENSQETRVTIIDKATSEIIRVVGELKPKSRSYYNRTLYEEYTNGPCVSRLYADFYMYGEGSFHEIVDVTATYWKTASSGGWTLEEKHSGYTKMKPNKFEIYGNATIEVASTSSMGIDFGFDFFDDLGFSMSGSKTSTWYAREIIDGGFVYEINR